ncbi:MAG TPA: glucosyltransferase I RfaG [Porticoccaceae bacterium]|nr:glucosyltransferase I RfaG [Porticoccaceae bacterium]
MKLALVLYKYFPFGGLQRDMLDIAQVAAQRGHQVTVFCSAWQGARPAGIDLHRIPGRGLSNAGRMQCFARHLAKALKGAKFDRVVGFNKWPGLDYYYAADSCFAEKAWRQRGMIYRMTARARCYLAFEQAIFSPASATRIFQLSAIERDKYIEFYQTPKARFLALPPGIPADRRIPQDWRRVRERTRQALGVGPEQTLLLAIGSGFRTKGLDRSLAALRDLNMPQARLLVVGQDNPRPFIQMVRRYGVAEQVEFLGGRSDIPELLLAGDVLLHPAYRENTGNVLLEAMVAGLPVVCSDACGYAHYVAEENMGHVVASPFEASAYSQAIRSVLAKGHEHWREKGAAFAARADVFSRASVAVDMLEAGLAAN